MIMTKWPNECLKTNTDFWCKNVWINVNGQTPQAQWQWQWLTAQSQESSRKQFNMNKTFKYVITDCQFCSKATVSDAKPGIQSY